IAAVVGLGLRHLRRETVAFHTYFNESVQGLDIGAPVKFRGVTIGAVSNLQIAPDHRHVVVTEDIDAKTVAQLGLTHVPPDLRAQLGSQGITGVKFVSIDFFDPKLNPLPVLPFELPPNYIPAAPSMMKNLEDTLTQAMDKLPDLVDAVVAIATRVDRMV